MVIGQAPFLVTVSNDSLRFSSQLFKNVKNIVIKKCIIEALACMKISVIKLHSSLQYTVCL